MPGAAPRDDGLGRGSRHPQGLAATFSAYTLGLRNSYEGAWEGFLSAKRKIVARLLASGAGLCNAFQHIYEAVERVIWPLIEAAGGMAPERVPRITVTLG